MIYKIVTHWGFFEVGDKGVTKIEKNPSKEGHYIVYYDGKYNPKTTEVDIISKDVLLYWCNEESELS